MGRDIEERDQLAGVAISIHAPRMGRDALVRAFNGKSRGFQSTRPVWGATRAR